MIWSIGQSSDTNLQHPFRVQVKELENWSQLNHAWTYFVCFQDIVGWSFEMILKGRSIEVSCKKYLLFLANFIVIGTIHGVQLVFLFAADTLTSLSSTTWVFNQKTLNVIMSMWSFQFQGLINKDFLLRKNFLKLRKWTEDKKPPTPRSHPHGPPHSYVNQNHFASLWKMVYKSQTTSKIAAQARKLVHREL